MKRISNSVKLVLATGVLVLSLGGVQVSALIGSDPVAPQAEPKTAEAKSKAAAEKQRGEKQRLAAMPEAKPANENAAVKQANTEPSELRKQGDNLITKLQAKKAGKVKTAEQKQAACEKRKKGLETKFKAIVTNSQRSQSKITNILNNAVAYKVSKNLAIADYDTLLTNAQSAQYASAESITALEGVKPTVDCTSPSAANDIATFKIAAQTTRTNLKTYRDSVKALLKTIKAATATSETPINVTPTTQTTTTEGGAQ